MSIVDQINAIVADQTISAQERSRIIGALRSGHLAEKISEIPLPRVFVRGQFTVVLTRLELHGIALYTWLYVTRAGKEIKLSYPIIIVRPPLLVADPLGTIVLGTPPNQQAYRLDPVEAYVNVIASVIKSALG